MNPGKGPPSIGYALYQGEPCHREAPRIVEPASIGAENVTCHQGIRTGVANALCRKCVLGGAVTTGEDAQCFDGPVVKGRHGGVRNKATDTSVNPA